MSGIVEPLVRVESVSIAYQTRAGLYVAVEHADFDINPDEFVALVGPSGAGKTTLLRAVAGLHPPTTGRVLIEGKPVSQPSPGVAVVFQDYSRSLLAWLTLRGNITLPLRARGVSRSDADSRAEAALESVGLKGKGQLHPWQLSGGMQQRVAIARALACEPKLLLMDEPFASVDAQTRMDLEDLVLGISRDLRVAIFMVTHDIDEATYLADRVIALTPPPARVARVIDIDLPSPRSQFDTRSLPRYAELRGEILDLVRRPSQAVPADQDVA